MYNRWLVREEYYGKFDSICIICTTRSISDAAFVIDGLAIQHAGRPFKYFAEKCSDDYFDYLDDIIQHDPFSDYDYTKYVNGISCIELKKGGI